MDSSRVALAKEVVSRASIAMENARLYTAVQEADRRKNEFLAMLAHELRNPLAPIRNAVHIMQGGDVTQPTMNWARDVIGRQADHMARLIDDLLDVSRIVQGKVVVKPEKLTPGVAGGALAWKAARRASPGATRCWRWNCRREPIELNGDAVRLAQVLSNLINNASKFSGPNTRITLSASYADGEVTISVKDEGAGIDPAFLPHIFDLFAQADQSLDRVAGRAGHRPDAGQAPGGAARRPRRRPTATGVGRGTEIVIALPAQPSAAAARRRTPRLRARSRKREPRRPAASWSWTTWRLRRKR